MMKDTGARYDAIVVGAGVAGLGVASALAEKGKSVLVISKNLQGEASPASAGILDPFLEINPGHPLFPLCRKAFRDYPAFIRRLAFPSPQPSPQRGEGRVRGNIVGYQKTGMFYIAMNASEKRELQKRYSWQKKTGIPVHWVSREAILKNNPGIRPTLHAGLFYPSIGRVQPRKLMAAWIRYAKGRGVHFLWTTRKISLATAAAKVQGVRSGRHFFEAPCVIQATGAWAGIPRAFGICAPVLPARGQILLVKGRLRIRTILHTLHGGYVVPWGRNEYLVGSNVEFRGFKPQVTRQGMEDILRRNRKILPHLDHCKRVKAWAGLRPFPKKGLPLIGPTRIKGLYLATGYYRSGVLISATAGKLLAKGVISSKMPRILKPFQPKNFGL